MSYRIGVRFCEACGVKLELICPACGATIPPDRKFCGACGQALTDAPAPALHTEQPTQIASPPAITIGERALTLARALGDFTLEVQTNEMLQRRGRLTYRAFKLQFNLDDEGKGFM